MPTLQDFLAGIKVAPKDVLAQSLASWTYNTLSDKALGPILESEFVANKLDNTSDYARKAIEFACHGLSGVTHAVQFTDGPISGFSATVLGSMFSEMAARAAKSPTQLTVIDITPESWYRHPDCQAEFGPEVQALAVKHLAQHFDQAGTADPSDVRASRIRGLLKKLKELIIAERDGLADLFNDADRLITNTRDRRKANRKRG